MAHENGGVAYKCYCPVLCFYKKVEKIFEEEPEIKNPLNPLKPEEFRGHVVFKNVSFKYNETPVLKNINIDAKPGVQLL